jgi:threonine/homoserine/homoserine lactone efflux protein
MVTFLENLILGITLTLPLGPVTLEVFRRGVKQGYLQSLICGLGAFTAELVYFSIIYLGLAKFSESVIVKYVLGTLGILFLLYLGYDAIKDFFAKQKNEKELKGSSFASGFFITFFNPINFFMWAGIIGASVSQDKTILINSGILLGILLSYLIISGLSIFGKKIFKNNLMKWFSLIAGLFLIGYAIKLAFDIFL